MYTGITSITSDGKITTTYNDRWGDVFTAVSVWDTSAGQLTSEITGEFGFTATAVSSINTITGEITTVTTVDGVDTESTTVIESDAGNLGGTVVL